MAGKEDEAMLTDKQKIQKGMKSRRADLMAFKAHVRAGVALALYVPIEREVKKVFALRRSLSPHKPGSSLWDGETHLLCAWILEEVTSIVFASIINNRDEGKRKLQYEQAERVLKMIFPDKLRSARKRQGKKIVKRKK